MMNEYERALAKHLNESNAEGATDLCFAEGWIAALMALRGMQSTWGTGGNLNSLLAQPTQGDVG